MSKASRALGRRQNALYHWGSKVRPFYLHDGSTWCLTCGRPVRQRFTRERGWRWMHQGDPFPPPIFGC